MTVSGHLPHGDSVGLLGGRNRAAQRRRIDHAGARRCHRLSPYPANSPRIQGTTHIRAALSEPVTTTTASAVKFHGYKLPPMTVRKFNVSVRADTALTGISVVYVSRSGASSDKLLTESRR